MTRIRRVLLVGFMGSGKSTVGAILAKALGWPLLDFDACVEAREGRTVAEIFGADGEDHFRVVESEVARELLSREHVVLAAGGGWAGVPGRLAALSHDTLSVWLRASLETLIQRTEGQPGLRPLLAGPEARETAAELLAQRSPAYAEAALEVDTDDRNPEDVSAQILAALGAQPTNNAVKATVRE
jgi:shikimate kinase